MPVRAGDSDESPSPAEGEGSLATEVYSILEGTGKVELDGEWHDVRPGSVVFIPPARDIGLSVRRESKRSWTPCPPFDAGDEVNEIKQHRAQAMESSLLPSLALGAG